MTSYWLFSDHVFESLYPPTSHLHVPHFGRLCFFIDKSCSKVLILKLKIKLMKYTNINICIVQLVKTSTHHRKSISKSVDGK